MTTAIMTTLKNNSDGSNGSSNNNKAISSSSSSSSSNDNSASVIAKRIKALLKVAPQDESLDAARLDELRRIFARQNELFSLAPHNNNNSSSTNSSVVVKQKWNRWLKQQHDILISQLQDRIIVGKRKSALRTFCGIIASSPITSTSNTSTNHNSIITNNNTIIIIPRINEQLVQKLVYALVHPSSNHNMDDDDDLSENDDDDDYDTNNTTIGMMEEDLLQMLDMEFMKPHQDFKYYILVAIRELSKSIYYYNNNKKKSQSSSTTKTTTTTTEEEQRISTISENLLRILLRIQITDDDKLILNNNNHDGTAKIGTNSHYLIPPPKQYFVSSNEVNTSITIDKDEEEEEEEEEEDDDDSESNSSSDDEENNIGKKRKANHTIGFGKKLKQGGKEIQKKTPPYMLYSKHLRLLQESWLELLKIPHLPSRALKLALQHLPIHVLPIVSAPLRFADFCMRAYDTDIITTPTTTSTAGAAVTSILALHSLYYLMLHHGLEYPKFYSSLYQLVTPSVFYAKHRTRFFKLLTNCLTKSQMLPGYLVAAFCKRLCRCALSAPPTGSLFVLALVSNLIRKHPECACLIHRGTNGTMVEDSFDAETNDPESCRALESSLWELNALGRHYHPAVAALAKSCGTEDEKTPLYDMNEFMLHTYKSLFEQERNKGQTNSKKKNKKKKTSPIALTFQPPKSLFIKSNGQTDLFGSILSLPSFTPTN